MAWEGTDPIKWATDMKEAPRNAINKFAFDVFKRVVTHTPEDTGACRQNWLVTVNGETDVYDPEKKSGGRVMSDGKKVIEGAKGDDTIVIQNSAPYVSTLEFGGYTDKPETEKTIGGFSKRAPHGMVGTTLSKAEDLWERAVKAAGEL
jgi:hypothetical protein